ncbi:hypothetical protein GGS20DRAFT_571283 [Poronia punctata]|nr:hypothetical protein GGS20DRAFT_571283 [Poronia punctata]
MNKWTHPRFISFARFLIPPLRRLFQGRLQLTCSSHDLTFKMASGFLILTAISIAFFSEAFIYGIAVPILPFMLRERAGSPDDLQWYCSLLLTAYSAASLVFAPLAGFVTDKIALRRVPFLAALLLMLISVALFFSAQSIWPLFLTRCLVTVPVSVLTCTGQVYTKTLI